MTQFKTPHLAIALALVAATAAAQACPKVTFINNTATIQSLVTSVNCLIDVTERSRMNPRAEQGGKPGFLVDSFPIIGPQHTRTYRKVVFAILEAPTGDKAKTVVVTPESAEATLSGAAGAECRVKINSDNSVDGQCNQMGGTLYVIFHN
jgi:hypothetical protein